MALMLPYEVYIPKRHLVYHMLDKIGYQGNPEVYSNWMDETLNKVMKKTCKNLSQQAFEPGLLLRMREVLLGEIAPFKKRFR